MSSKIYKIVAKYNYVWSNIGILSYKSSPLKTIRDTSVLKVSRKTEIGTKKMI